MIIPLISLFFACVYMVCAAEATTNSFYIITGGPGSGKTALIEELRSRGIFCIDEVAREIIQEEMAAGGSALPGENIGRRIEEMVRRSIKTYQQAAKEGKLAIFDRGVLDYIGYAERTGTPILEELQKAGMNLKYNKKVFITPVWEEIYCNDNERKQTFEEAIGVYHNCFNIYSKHGYEVIVLPKIDVKGRADFLLDNL